MRESPAAESPRRHPAPKEMIDWQEIDTVLLDMDGTLLDLRFDNMLWNQLVPDRYCKTRSPTAAGAREQLLNHMRDTRHTLEFYCLDYWARYTGLEILALHHELAHLIRYRPGAETFLGWLRGRGIRMILVTNAHRDSLAVKHARSGLCGAMHASVSSHDYGHPKETVPFWASLAERHPFDARSTLLIDDNQAVLDAAATFGIQHLLTIRQPDSAQPSRSSLAFQAFNDFAELLPDG